MNRQYLNGLSWKRLGCVVVVLTLTAIARAGGPPGAENVVLLGDPAFRQGDAITAIEPMGRGRLLTAGQDGTLRIWDGSTGRELQRFVDEGDEDLWCGLKRPGHNEVFSSGTSQRVIRWDVETGKQLGVYDHKDTVFRVVCTPDGKLLATGDNKGTARVWDVESGKVLHELKGHKQAVYTVAISADGKRLFTGSDDETVRVWNLETGETTKIFKPTLGDIFTIELSPDGKQLLVACEAKNNSILLLDSETMDVKRRFEVPRSTYIARFSPDGKQVAGICHDNQLYIFEAETGKIIHQLPLPEVNHWALRYSEDGKELYCGLDNMLVCVDVASGKRTFPPADQPMLPGYTQAVVAFANGTVVWALDDGGLAVGIPGSKRPPAVLMEEDSFSELAITPDGTKLLAGCDDDRAYVFDEKGKKLSTANHGSTITAVAWAPDGRAFVTGGWDERIAVWDAESSQLRHGMGGHDGTIRGLSFGPSGVLLSISDDKTLRAWDIAGGRELKRIVANKANFRGLAGLSKLGMFLASEDGRLRCWQSIGKDGKNLSKQQVRELAEQLSAGSYQQRQEATDALIKAGPGVMDVLKAQADGSPEMDFRIDRIRSAMISRDNSYEEIAAFDLQGKTAGPIAVHPNGKYFALIDGSYGQARVLVGSIVNGKIQTLPPITSPHMPASLAFAPDGRLLVGNRNGTVSVYSLTGFVDKSKTPPAPQAAPAAAPVPPNKPQYKVAIGADGDGDDVVTVVDATNRQKVRMKWDDQQQRMVNVTDGPGRQLAEDFKRDTPASQPTSQAATQPTTQPAKQGATGMDAPEGVADLAKAIAGKRAELDKQRGKPGQYEVGLSGDMIVVKDTHTGKTTHYRFDPAQKKLVFISPESAATQPAEAKTEAERQNQARELEKRRQASEGLEKVAEAIEVYKAQQAVAASAAASQPTSQPAASQPAEAETNDEPRARGRWVYEGGKWVRKRENDAPSADE